MKKLLLTAVGVLGFAGMIMAQGTVNWVSISPGAILPETNSAVASTIFGSDSAISGTTGKTLAPAGSFYFELLWDTASTATPTTKNALAGWSDTGLEAENNTGAGTILVLNQSQSGTALGTTSGEAVSLMLVGWSANYGTTWSAALNALNAGATTGFFGETSAYNITLGTANPGATVIGSSTSGLIFANPFIMNQVTTVPEPTTLALSALGGLSLLAFRRKKA